MKTYNTSIHEGMEFMPHELMFARAARILTSSIVPDVNDDESYPEYATTLFKRIFDAEASACENLKLAKINNDLILWPKSEPAGIQREWLRIFVKRTIRNHKFDEEYIGPYKILETLRNNNVKLMISEQLFITYRYHLSVITYR